MRVISKCNHALAQIPDSIFKQPRKIQLLIRHCEPTGRANARPMTGSAKQSILPRKERMDCFASLAMTVSRHPYKSRDAKRPRLRISRPLEGVGDAGGPLHPQPRVQSVVWHTR